MNKEELAQLINMTKLPTMFHTQYNRDWLVAGKKHSASTLNSKSFIQTMKG